MGTRAIVAIPEGDGWKGRYTHWDGYPSGRGNALWLLVQRDGLERVQDVVVRQHGGWSMLNLDPEPELTQGYDDGRFLSVPGYGVAYNHESDQCSLDQWITPEGDKCGTEWLYVLSPGGLLVGEVSWKDDSIAPVGLYPWDGPEPDWAKLNEGVLQDA